MEVKLLHDNGIYINRSTQPGKPPHQLHVDVGPVVIPPILTPETNYGNFVIRIQLYIKLLKNSISVGNKLPTLPPTTGVARNDLKYQVSISEISGLILPLLVRITALTWRRVIFNSPGKCSPSSVWKEVRSAGEKSAAGTYSMRIWSGAS